uniref:Uncharacterized protein n=1 Tax=Rhizophora mucronata TaxID=61149 RepID=A0A2P2MDY1_RHIMU
MIEMTTVHNTNFTFHNQKP